MAEWLQRTLQMPLMGQPDSYSWSHYLPPAILSIQEGFRFFSSRAYFILRLSGHFVCAYCNNASTFQLSLCVQTQGQYVPNSLIHISYHLSFLVLWIWKERAKDRLCPQQSSALLNIFVFSSLIQKVILPSWCSRSNVTLSLFVTTDHYSVWASGFVAV